MMMRMFNGLQLTVCFVLAPFGISWLSTQEFPGSTAAFVGSIVAYIMLFIFNWSMVTWGLHGDNWKW